jgi:hypothetical protein
VPSSRSWSDTSSGEPRDGAQAVDQYLGSVVPIGAYGYRLAGTRTDRRLLADEAYL